MDNPGEYQKSVTDSTSPNESSSSNIERASNTNSESQISSTAHTFIACSSSNIETTEYKSLSPPTNPSKTKSQQTQHYQFRAPQQYVKHKKTSSTLFKKNKTWNKRQNKNGKLPNQSGLPVANNHVGVNLAESAASSNNIAPGGVVHTNSTNKADLENIQNLRNQPGGYHYYQRSTGGIVERGGTIVEVLPPVVPLGPEKILFGHGHVKQQSYKKMLSHNRGHHHHILCAGAAHNTHGASLPLNCCHISGCVGHNSKDTVSHNGSLGTNTNSNVSCCIRSKFFLPDKRPRKEVIIPPTKFLLGGNISDPLNLNSLQNETSNTSTNNTPATTPRRSPITTPPKVEVIIPPNIHDPLHLLDPVDTMEYEKQLTSPMKRGCKVVAGFRHHKHRHRKNRKPKRRRNDSYNSNATTSSFLTSPEPEDTTTTMGISSTSTNESSQTMLSLPNVLDNTNTISINSTLLSEKPVEREEQIESEPLKANTDSIQMSALLQTTAPIAGHSAKGNVTFDGPFSLNKKQKQEEKLDTTNNDKRTTATTIVEPIRTTNADSNTLRANVAVVELVAREPSICRDMRLELSSTTSSTCSIVSGSSGVLPSDLLSADICDTSTFTGADANDGTNDGGGLSVVSGVAAGVNVGVGSRKRKISESSIAQKAKKHGRYDLMDKIVSPVVPQPGAWKRPPRLAATGARKPATKRSRSVSDSDILSPIDECIKSKNDESGQEESSELNKTETFSESGLGSPLSTTSAATSLAAGELDPPCETTSVEPSAIIKGEKAKTTHRSIKMPKFPPNGAKYRYGNYDRYAGCRSLTEIMDVRLQVFQRNVELFENKDVLDIGCNSGYMSISIGRNLAPKSVLGIDIDEKLITKARMNLALHVRIPIDEKKQIKKEDKFESKEDQKQDPIQDTNNKNPKKCRRKRARRKNKNIQLQLQPIHHIHPLIHHHHMQMHYTNMKLRELKVDSKELFPISFPLLYGPILKISATSQPSLSSSTKNTPSHPPETVNTSSNFENGAHATPGFSTKTGLFLPTNSCSTGNTFPNNIYFRQTNYVLKDEAHLANETQLYDVIICLSVTKWIHLNFGDAGLKMAFKRMFNQLRPGGKLILEAQNWASYKKKKNLTEDIYLNYRQIEFFPNKFHEYLLSSEVGFSHSYTLGVPRHLNKGFSRPIQLYAKGDYTPNHVRWSDAYYPQTPYEAYRGIYATMPPRPDVCQMSSTRSQTYDTPHYTGGASSGPYSCRQTPMHQPTSQYYNPLETDSYQPSYDMEYLNHMYVFASPLYQTVWSPPASMRRTSSTHTPIYGSVREAEIDGDGYIGPSSGGCYHRHVYPPNDDTMSPNANTSNAFNSIRDPDTDDSNQTPGSHVYATTCGESSSSPHVNHNYSEAIEGLLDDEQNANHNEI